MSDKVIDLHDMGCVALMSPATMAWLQELGEVAGDGTINGIPVVVDESMQDGVTKITGVENAD